MEKLTKILRNRILLTATLIVSFVTILIVWGLLRDDPACVLQGQAEATDYRVSTKVPSRVVRLYVREGQRVRSGDTLVVLSTDEIDAERQKATAVYESVRALEENINLGSRKEQIQSAYESWQKARAKTEMAEKTFRRTDNLYREGVATAQKHDEAQARLDAAVAEERMAKAMYDLQLEGARGEERRAAHAQSDAARAGIAVVNALVKETVLRAQTDGVVAEIFPEEGELIGLGAPIMNIVSDDWWFTFNIREDELPGIEVGKEASVYLPAKGKRVPVRISRVKNVGDFAAWKATRALEGIDLKVFEVRATPQQPVEGLEAGMSAVLERLGD